MFKVRYMYVPNRPVSMALLGIDSAEHDTSRRTLTSKLSIAVSGLQQVTVIASWKLIAGCQLHKAATACIDECDSCLNAAWSKWTDVDFPPCCSMLP